jgi:phosphate transport system protein
MEMHQLSRHISEQYDAELEIVRRRLMEMGGMVEQQLRDAIKAISTYDAELAAKVSARDHEVNRFEVTLDEQCIHIIARRQPTATDLRLLVTVMKSSTDLERIGDEANRIAKMARELSSLDYQKNLYGETARLGQLSTTMVSRALDALARLDTKEALDLIAADKQVDEEYRAVIQLLANSMTENPDAVERDLHLIWVARSLERIGDHAKNISEYVLYLVEGKDIRHLPKGTFGTLKPDS